jgi:hypothetical protein
VLSIQLNCRFEGTRADGTLAANVSVPDVLEVLGVLAQLGPTPLLV